MSATELLAAAKAATAAELRHELRKARAEKQQQSKQVAKRYHPCSVYVTNIGPNTTATQIDVALRQFGSVKDVQLQPGASKKAPGLAFVEFVSESSAKECLKMTTTRSRQRVVVSVNGRPLAFERRELNGADALGPRPVDGVDASLSDAAEFLASCEEAVVADVEAAIVAAGGALKRDDLGAVVAGRLDTQLTSWLRALPRRFKLEELTNGVCLVKERIAADVETALRQTAMPEVDVGQMAKAFGDVLLKRLHDALPDAESGGSPLKAWLQARTKLFAVNDHDQRWAVSLAGGDTRRAGAGSSGSNPSSPACAASSIASSAGIDPADIERVSMTMGSGLSSTRIVASDTVTILFPVRTLEPEPEPEPSSVGLLPESTAEDEPPEIKEWVSPGGELHEYLKYHGYLKYEERFVANEVDFNALLCCARDDAEGEKDLQGMSVAKGPRVKILRTVGHWRTEDKEPARARPSRARSAGAPAKLGDGIPSPAAVIPGPPDLPRPPRNNLQQQRQRQRQQQLQLQQLQLQMQELNSPLADIAAAEALQLSLLQQETSLADVAAAEERVAEARVAQQQQQDASLAEVAAAEARVAEARVVMQRAEVDKVKFDIEDAAAEKRMQDTLTSISNAGRPPAADIDPLGRTTERPAETTRVAVEQHMDNPPPPPPGWDAGLEPLSATDSWSEPAVVAPAPRAQPAQPAAADSVEPNLSWQQQQWSTGGSIDPERLADFRKAAYVAVVRDREVSKLLAQLAQVLMEKKSHGGQKGTPRQDAARFFCAYVFKAFADGGDGGWGHVGGVNDPLIPSSVVAWPSLKEDFSVLIRKYWAATTTGSDITAALDRMLKQWKAAARRVTEARTHTKALSAVVQHSSNPGDLEKTVLSCCGRELVIETFALTMLRERFDRYATTINDDDRLEVYDDETFFTIAFTMQMRYESLASFDQGNQGALPQSAFQVLREEFGVRHECFASPLNVCPGAPEQTFNSIFYDVDKFFGSKKSFFEFWPETGAYEVNPPFDHDSVARTFHHINEVMMAAETKARVDGQEELPLLFIVISPFSTDAADDFLLRSAKLRANEHYFTKGFQHRKTEKHIQDRSTTITFIGNDEADRTWAICDTTVRKLQAAFSKDLGPGSSNARTVAENSNQAFSIPTAMLGKVIGIKGANVNALEQKTGCTIQVQKNQRNSGNTMTAVTFRGSAEQISQAQAEIQQMVHATTAREARVKQMKETAAELKKKKAAAAAAAAKLKQEKQAQQEKVRQRNAAALAAQRKVNGDLNGTKSSQADPHAATGDQAIRDARDPVATVMKCYRANFVEYLDMREDAEPSSYDDTLMAMPLGTTVTALVLYAVCTTVSQNVAAAAVAAVNSADRQKRQEQEALAEVDLAAKLEKEAFVKRKNEVVLAVARERQRREETVAQRALADALEVKRRELEESPTPSKCGGKKAKGKAKGKKLTEATLATIGSSGNSDGKGPALSKKDRKEREKQKLKAQLALARSQLDEMVVYVSGCALKHVNGLYYPNPAFEGWPRFENDLGNHFFHYTELDPTKEALDGWRIGNVYSPTKDCCSCWVKSGDGAVRTGAQKWTCYVDSAWVPGTLTVSVVPEEEGERMFDEDEELD